MTEIEVLNNKFDDYCNNEFELYNMCVDYIKDRLGSLPKNEIYLDQNVLPIVIRHYSNGVVTFRSVNRVYLIDGNIYADLKCVDSYEITCTEVVDLYKIAKAISSIIEK